jgi:putative molybdopterin biosynthesis protein
MASLSAPPTPLALPRITRSGIHLLNPATGKYNEPFLGPGLRMQRGYGRLQGLVHWSGDCRFQGKSVPDAVATALADADCVMVNRNRGSGTRVLIDQLLQGRSHRVC